MKPIYFRPGTLVERSCSKCALVKASVSCSTLWSELLISCDSGERGKNATDRHQGNYTFEPEEGAILVGHIESKD